MKNSRYFIPLLAFALVATLATLAAFAGTPHAIADVYSLAPPPDLLGAGLAFGAAGLTTEDRDVIMTAVKELFGEVNEKTVKLQGDLTELQQKSDKWDHLREAGLNIELAGGGTCAKMVSDLVASEQFKKVEKGLAKEVTLAFDIKGAMGQKTAVLSSATLVQPQRTGMYGAPTRPLRVRDVIPTVPTSAGSIEFVRYSVTNNAAVQYSSPNIDGGTKPESAMTFTLLTRGASTIAHWIPASRQVLADSAGLQSLIENELLIGLGDEEDDEILNGDATGGHLDGLLHNATAFNRTRTGDTMADTLRRSITQVRLAKGRANAILLHPGDAENLDLLKDGEARYLQVMINGVAWAVPVVQTEAIGEGTWLTGDFNRAAQLHVREEGMIRIAEQHDDFFIKNMVVILAEERVILELRRPSMLVKGTF